MRIEGYMAFDSLPEPNLFLRLSEELWSPVLHSCWKSFSLCSFSAGPGVPTKVLPRAEVLRLLVWGLLVGWVVLVGYVLVLWAQCTFKGWEVPYNSCVATAISGSFYVSFCFLLGFGSAPKGHFKQQPLIGFPHLNLGATPRPTSSSQKNVCVWLHTHNEKRNSTYDEVFSICKCKALVGIAGFMCWWMLWCM